MRSVEMIGLVARHLGELREEVVFLGGAVAGLRGAMTLCRALLSRPGGASPYSSLQYPGLRPGLSYPAPLGLSGVAKR